MARQSQHYKDIETLLNSNPGITNIISQSLAGSVAQNKNHLERDYTITTYGFPKCSISNKTPINGTRYKHVGDPIPAFDRAAKIVDTKVDPFETHSYSNSPHISGDTGKWIIGNTSENCPYDPEKGEFSGPPIQQTDLHDEQ